MALPRVPRRYASRIFKHLDAVVAAQLWHAADGPHREAMLASGGRGAGALWLAMPDRASDLFGTSHFRMATLLRLNAFRPPRAAVCQLASWTASAEGCGEGRQCGRMLGARGAHALLCKLGPARMRPHRQLAAVLARELRDVGAEVDMERVVPELAQQVAAAAPAASGPLRPGGGDVVTEGAVGAPSCSDRGGGAAVAASALGPLGSPPADGRVLWDEAGSGGAQGSSWAGAPPGGGVGGSHGGAVGGVRRPADAPDAIMDLVVAFPGSLAQVWVDVSIRCPHAERHMRARIGSPVPQLTARQKKSASGTGRSSCPSSSSRMAASAARAGGP